MKLFKISLLLIFTVFWRSSFACSCLNDFDRPMQLDDLKKYNFIALVRINSEQVIKPSDPNTIGFQSLLSIKVIEQFKGQVTAQIIENQVNTSCDIGVDIGEEWLVFATVPNGTPAMFPCDRNVQFKAKDGLRDWHFQGGFRQLDELRILYGHKTRFKPDGIYVEHYSNGKKELEENYVNGLRNGKRTVYYPNGGIYGKENYLDDSLQGEASWYYPSGQLYVRKYFERGQPRNVTKVYYDSTIDQSYKNLLIRDFYKSEDSLRFVYGRFQVKHENVFDSFGREVVFREFDRLGIIRHESIYNPEPGVVTRIYYHKNGTAKGISYTRDGKDYGHYQEYDENGAPSKSWDYDQDGQQIKSSIWMKK